MSFFWLGRESLERYSPRQEVTWCGGGRGADDDESGVLVF